MKHILSIIISGAFVVSGFGQTRNVLVGTNNAVVQPTNFWSVDASNARTGLGLGTAATNPASAFQPSSSVLTNIASSNAVNLTNLRATNIIGIIPFSNIPTVNLTNISGILEVASGGTGATNAATARTNLGLGWSALTNTNATNFRNAIELGTFKTTANDVFSEIYSGQDVRIIAGDSILFYEAFSFDGTNAAIYASESRNSLGLGVTNSVVFNSLHAEQDASGSVYSLTLGQTNTGFRGTGGGSNDFVFTRSGTNIFGLTSGNVQSFVVHSFSAPIILNYGSGSTSVISFGGIDAATGAAISRTNLGIGWSALTNPNAATFQTALFGSNTNPVLVDTNGSVVSPTNFWQVAPIVARFIETQPTTNQTTNIVAARNLHIHSLAISVVGVTNTIALPTTNSFNGDVALVVHQGPTSSVTAVRTAGATSNIITLNQFEQTVEFIYYDNVWQLNHNQSFIEPIFFSGINATANVAASRTNLSLGATWLTNTNVTNFRTAIGTTASGGAGAGSILVRRDNIVSVNSDGTNSIAIGTLNVAASGQNAVAIGADGISATGYASTVIGGADNTASATLSFASGFKAKATNVGAFVWQSDNGLNTNMFYSTNDLSFNVRSTGGMSLDLGTNGISFRTNASAAATRTNLGLGATNTPAFRGLTSDGNIVITNQSAATNGLLFVYRTNSESFLGLANLIASNNTTISNETLFRVGTAEATNCSAQFGFRSTNTNGNGVAVFSVFGYNALMMIGPSDPNAGTNPIEATLYSVSPTNKVMTLVRTNTGATMFHRPIEFENTTNQAVTRTNLGIPLAALTNANNAGFQRAILQTNSTPATAANLGDAKAWLEISVVTNSVTNSFRIPVFQ